MTQAIAPTRAALSILVGMAVLGLSDNFILYITDASSLWQFHLLRSLTALFVMGVIAMAGMGVIWPKRFWAVGARSAIQGISMLIYFGCLAILPVSLVVAGFFTSPLFVSLIAAVFQGRRITALHALAIFLGFAGALLVIRPDPANLDLVAFVPIVAGLCYAIGAVATRAWCEGEGTLSLTAGFFVMLGLMGAVGCLVFPGVGSGVDDFAARGWMPVNIDMLFWIALQAIGTLIGIMCLFRGYQIGEASSVAVFEFSLLIFASAWAWYLWDQAITPLALCGMALIVVSGAVIALRQPG
ncbi:EamA-like transporter family protein [Yoonia maricola]|uniref:EamA-like transporter family protein n=1 Tax=Yoonia maricola TaxID=420999 RepID=A0A2M8W223_9RHOB|nr:DMT family transporter [Yoonia maricola]PJI84960.1 EamA-like transporter family protein [Yoonia maricola]